MSSLINQKTGTLGAGALFIGTAGWVSHFGDTHRCGNEEALPKTYDHEAIADVWMQYPSAVLRRIVVIGTKVVPYLARLQYARYNTETGKFNRSLAKEEQKQWAVEFRELLTCLGPTFIKFGQMLSIRPDILPPQAVYELQKLCDSCPSFPTDIAIDIIEKELGKRVGEVYEGINLDTVPIAAASLGQVYMCKLRDTGETVAVKVQRPDMIRAVSLDLFLLRKYTKFVEASKGFLMRQGILAQRDQYDVKLLDSFAAASYLELDYNHEAANQQRFIEEFADRMKDTLYIPPVYWKHTARKVLTTEWVHGKQLAKSSADVIERLTPVGVKCFLAQLLETGFFHGDPHPGNLLVREDDGRLVLIDFGLCATVAQPDTESMTATIVHLMEGDVKGLLKDAVQLGFLPEDVDRSKLLPVLQNIFDEARIQAEKELVEIENPAPGQSKYTAMASRRKKFSVISEDLNQVALVERPQFSFLCNLQAYVYLAEVETLCNLVSFSPLLCLQPLPSFLPSFLPACLPAFQPPCFCCQVFFEFPFLVPDYFALITRALIVLEGIAVTGNSCAMEPGGRLQTRACALGRGGVNMSLFRRRVFFSDPYRLVFPVVGDPGFDIFQAAYPYARSRAHKLFGYSNLVRIQTFQISIFKSAGCCDPPPACPFSFSPVFMRHHFFTGPNCNSQDSCSGKHKRVVPFTINNA
jgi:aarF domain-containing kinase